MKDIDFNDYAIRLSSGAHMSPDVGMCVMECVAYIEGEAHTDEPKCACPIIGALAQRINDALPDEDRQTLKKYIFRLAGSRSNKHVEEQRLFILMTYCFRFVGKITLLGSQYEHHAHEFLVDINSWKDFHRPYAIAQQIFICADSRSPLIALSMMKIKSIGNSTPLIKCAHLILGTTNIHGIHHGLRNHGVRFYKEEMIECLEKMLAVGAPEPLELDTATRMGGDKLKELVAITNPKISETI